MLSQNLYELNKIKLVKDDTYTFLAFK